MLSPGLKPDISFDLKSGLDQLQRNLKKNRSFLTDVAYSLVKTVNDLTPETRYWNFEEHGVALGQATWETITTVGRGLKQSLWDEKNNFVNGAIQKSQTHGTFLEPIVATFYTGIFYGYKFTAGAAIDIWKGLSQGVQIIARGGATEDILQGVAMVYGSVGAIAAVAGGGLGFSRMAPKAPTMGMFGTVPMGDHLAVVGLALPEATPTAVATGGALGAIANASQGGGSTPKKSLEEIIDELAEDPNILPESLRDLFKKERDTILADARRRTGFVKDERNAVRFAIEGWVTSTSMKQSYAWYQELMRSLDKEPISFLQFKTKEAWSNFAYLKDHHIGIGSRVIAKKGMKPGMERGSSSEFYEITDITRDGRIKLKDPDGNFIKGHQRPIDFSPSS